MRVKAVILDMDGTVVEFRYNAGKAKRDLKAFVIMQGMPEDIFYDEEPLAVNVDSIEKRLHENGDLHKAGDLKRGMERIVGKYEMSAARSTEVFEGAREAILELAGMGIKVGVYSNSGRKALETVLKRFELDDCFSCTLSRDEVEKMKPHPDGVLKALEELGTTPEETIFVGDSTIDMVAAHRSGVLAIGVVSGIKGEKDLRDAGASHIIHSIMDLPALIMEIVAEGGEGDGPV